METPIYLEFSQDDLNRTIRSIRKLSIADLRSFLYLLGLSMSGTKDQLFERVRLHFENKTNINEAARLAAIKDVLERIKTKGKLVSYNDLYNFYCSRGRSRRGTPSTSSPGLHSQDSIPDRDHDINFIDNPFFRAMKKIHVSPQACRPSKAKSKCRIDFVFNVEEHKWLKREDPNMRIYLVCGRKMEEGSASNDVEIEYPIPHNLYVNGQRVNKTYEGIRHKPGTAKPVDVTDLLLGPPKLNKIRMIYEDDTYTYYVYLYFVKIISLETVIKDIMKQPKIRKEDTTERIKKISIKSSSNGIETGNALLSLKDPYTFTRIKIPIKTIECEHLECFDLNYFMTQQQENPTWECPYCGASFEVSDLAICEYFEDILKKVDSDVDYVSIMKNGEWRLTDSDVTKQALKVEELEDVTEAEVSQTKVKLEPRKDATPPEFIFSTDEEGGENDSDEVEELSLATRATKLENSTEIIVKAGVEGTNRSSAEVFDNNSSQNSAPVLSNEIARVGGNTNEQNITSSLSESSLVSHGLTSAHTSPRDTRSSTRFQRHRLHKQREHEEQVAEHQQEPQSLAANPMNVSDSQEHSVSHRTPLLSDSANNKSSQPNNSTTTPALSGVDDLQRIQERYRTTLLTQGAISSTPTENTGSLLNDILRYGQSSIEKRISQIEGQQGIDQDGSSKGVLTAEQRRLQQNIQLLALQQDQTTMAHKQHSHLPGSSSHAHTSEVQHQKNINNSSKAIELKGQNSLQSPQNRLLRNKTPQIISTEVESGKTVATSKSPAKKSHSQSKDREPPRKAASKQKEQHVPHPKGELDSTDLFLQSLGLLPNGSIDTNAVNSRNGKSQLKDVNTLSPIHGLEAEPKRSNHVTNGFVEPSSTSGNGSRKVSHLVKESGRVSKVNGLQTNIREAPQGTRASPEKELSNAVAPTNPTTLAGKHAQSAHEKLQKQYSSLFIRTKRPHPPPERSSEKKTGSAKGNETIRSSSETVGAAMSPNSQSGESPGEGQTSEDHGDSDIDYLFVEDEEMSEVEKTSRPTEHAQSEDIYVNGSKKNGVAESTSHMQPRDQIVLGESELERHVARQMRSQVGGTVQNQLLNESIQNAAFTELQQTISQFESDTKRMLEYIEQDYASDPVQRDVILKHIANSREKDKVKVVDEFVNNYFDLVSKILPKSNGPEIAHKDSTPHESTNSMQTEDRNSHSLQDSNVPDSGMNHPQAGSHRESNLTGVKRAGSIDPNQSMLTHNLSNLNGDSLVPDSLPPSTLGSHPTSSFSPVAATLSSDTPTTQKNELKKGQFKIDESFFDDSKAPEYIPPADDMKENSTVFVNGKNNLQVQHVSMDVDFRSNAPNSEPDFKQTESLVEERETSPSKRRKLIELLECELGKGKLINKFLVFQDYTSEPDDMKQMEEAWVKGLQEREERINKIVFSGSSNDPIVLDSDSD
ncbi:SIZ1 [Candida metapsilosis]|uniref:SIZ1 n=1 Tax=Candida metapsilosis TaxID=273372 RepID=A0A8H7ZKY7_9ASCO|nr:SIZ1 [Candida metapsilosis]